MLFAGILRAAPRVCLALRLLLRVQRLKAGQTFKFAVCFCRTIAYVI
jgi:hypothetical protein